MDSALSVPRRVDGRIQSTAIGELTDTEIALVQLSTAAWKSRTLTSDAETVIYRLEQAGMTLLALPVPGCYPSGKGSFWPDVVHGVTEAYGYGRVAIRPAVPSADAITRMDDTFAWLAMIPDDKHVIRRVAAMRCLVHPVTERHVHTWRGIAKAVRSNHTAVQRMHAQAVAFIVAGLLDQQRRKKNAVGRSFLFQNAPKLGISSLRLARLHPDALEQAI